MYDAILPIVLVGGASRRFGRDKLREPVGGGLLVDRPIAVLREVFGPRVAVVGDCHTKVAARADRHIADRYPGTGPLGGIAAAIEASDCDVFVLPGDAPLITADLVRKILDVSVSSRDAWAVLANTDRPEPCIGLYRRTSLAALKSCLSGSLALRDAVPAHHRVLVKVDRAQAVNANTPESLRTATGVTPRAGS